MKNNQAFTNLLVNIILPVLILTKLSKENYLGPTVALIIAVSIPLLYGLYELIYLKQKNFIALIGFIGVLLTGIIGLYQFPPHWIAVKEAAIPFIIGTIVLISTKKSWQVINKLLFHEDVFKIDTINEIIQQSNQEKQLNKILSKANIWLSFSFFISAILNYVLAKLLVHSSAGSLAFNEEIGKMTFYSYFVIAIPSLLIMMFIFYGLINAIKKITQLETKEILAI